MNKTFKYRIYPTKAQAARMLNWESAMRWLWNIAHEQRLLGLSRQRAERRYYSAYDQHKELTELRRDVEWLADVPRNVCEHLLTQLDVAWARCFRRIGGRPRWKRKDFDRPSLQETHPSSWRLDGSRLFFPKLGPVRVVVHRAPVGKPRTCAIKRDGDQWFVCIVCEIDDPDPAQRVEPVVAIDRGIVNLIADSDGRIVQNPSHLERSLGSLARAQRAISRRKVGSNGRKKAVNRVNRIHRKIRRQREHTLHVLSHDYAKSHGTVVVEKLQVNNVVRVGGVLARRIGGAGWGRLVEMLRYKLTWSGGQLVEVPAAYSSQTCAGCGHVASASRRSQSKFCCVACGLADHADLNAAKVLKSRWKPSVLPVEASAVAGLRSRKSGPKSMVEKVPC